MPKLLGIINVTPDSFSDGGESLKPEDALHAIASAINDGASLVDIGAESTRPGATPITPEEEWGRLAPVLEGVSALGFPFSVDTRQPVNAVKALIYNAAWINDVSGFSTIGMIAAVQESNCKLVLMHSLSVPADPAQVLPDNGVTETVLAWGAQRIGALKQAGIAKERIIFDPGIGFGKTAKASHELIDNIASFKQLGVPILVGHSRKSFLGTGTTEERDAKTLEVSRYLAGQGVDYLRVHNIALHKNL